MIATPARSKEGCFVPELESGLGSDVKSQTRKTKGFCRGTAAASPQKAAFFADDPAKIESIHLLEISALRHQGPPYA